MLPGQLNSRLDLLSRRQWGYETLDDSTEEATGCGELRTGTLMNGLQ